MKKKLVFLLLACLLLCLASTSAMADKVTGADRIIDYWVHNDYSEVYSYHGAPTKVIIQSVIEGKPVTEVGHKAFKDCTSLQTITLPNSITSIGAEAFLNCTGLQSITLPNSITSIGKEAFRNCTGLQSITLPNSITSIGIEAFWNCTGLQSITLPNSITHIGFRAFRNCTGLLSITIPSSVIDIAYEAFESCKNLKNIIFESTTPPQIIYTWLDGAGVETISVPTGSKTAYQNAVGAAHADKVVEYMSVAQVSPSDVDIRLITTELPADEHSKLEPEAKKKGAEALGVGLLDLVDLRDPLGSVRVLIEEWRLEIRRSIDEAWEEAKIKMIISDYPETYPDGKLPISIPLPAAVVGKDVAVLHYVDGAWKREASTVSGGQLTTHIASLSPVAIVWAEEEVVNVDLPKTGDESSVILWSALACISLFGVIALARKKKKA